MAAAGAGALLLFPASGASAQVVAQACPAYPALSCPTPALPNNGAAPAAAGTGNLAFTGSDVIELGGIGVATIGVGAVLVRRSRARRSAD
jgi:hypothetical protein